MHVRAMFRVLSVSRDYNKLPLIKLGPTYSTRDGVVCEENKSFSKWTPSGDCELATEAGELFPEGGYVYIDLYPLADAPPVPVGALRLEMCATRYEVDASGDGSFTTRIYPTGSIRGSLSMNVTNLSPAVVGLFRLEPGAGGRALAVDFSPVP